MEQFKALGRNTQVVLGTGALALVVSFVDAYTRASSGGRSQNLWNAWDGWGTLGMLLLIAALAITAVKAFAGESLPREVPWNLIALATGAFSAVILVIKPFVVDVPSVLGDVSVGPGWSGWLMIVLVLVFVAFLALSFKASGEKLPEFNKGNNNTPPAA